MPIDERAEPLLESARSWVTIVPTVLIVDDNLDTCDTFARYLNLAGFHALSASTPEQAMDIAASSDVDVLLLDQRLGPTTGLALRRRLRDAGCDAPFVLMSGYMDVATAIEAMRQGASDVLSAPVNANELGDILLTAIAPKGHPTVPEHTLSSAEPSDLEPLTSHGQLARLVIRAIASELDLFNTEAWSHFVGISQTGLSEICWQCDVSAHDAKNYARMLRAAWRSCDVGLPAKGFLKVGDRRTLHKLFEASGIESWEASQNLVALFVRNQRFIPTGNPVAMAIRSLLTASDTWARSVVIASLAPDVSSSLRSTSHVTLQRHKSTQVQLSPEQNDAVIRGLRQVLSSADSSAEWARMAEVLDTKAVCIRSDRRWRDISKCVTWLRKQPIVAFDHPAVQTLNHRLQANPSHPL